MKWRFLLTGFLLAAFGFAGVASAQFSSGSTQVDGALNYPTAGTYDFDPQVLGINAAGDNIFNFTTINIGPNVTLNFKSSKVRGKPVIWLASGNVTIAGTLVLSGAAGATMGNGADWITFRAPTEPGPGGFPGGVGGRPGTAPNPGLGPGGGPTPSNATCNYGNSASFSSVGFGTPPAPTYGNIQQAPLIGGSGGSGGCLQANQAADSAGGTGGAGAGALRIVSSTQITLTGTILANGGEGGVGHGTGAGYGGCGSGGMLNLIAPVVTGPGTMQALGYNPNVSFPCPNAGVNASAGYILVNAQTNTYTGSASPGATLRPLLAPPLPTFTTSPTVTINSVNGVNVPQPPAGAFLTPDVTINATTAVTINISAVGVPVGTVVKLNVQSELGPDQNVNCTPLAGTTASSTATCSASFPTSVSRILASASW